MLNMRKKLIKCLTGSHFRASLLAHSLLPVTRITLNEVPSKIILILGSV
jgi:hypothetical protein